MKIMYKQHNKYKNEERMDSVTEDWNGWQLWFWKLIILSVFQISFVWFVMFDIMLGRHLFDTMQSCDFVIYKQFLKFQSEY